MDERAISQDIVDTVIGLAAERGVAVADVTIDDISRAVGVSRMTLYRRIGSRAALHAAVRRGGIDPGDRPPVRTRAVDAAAAIIREGGIAALTLEAVAERAACSLPALHSQLGGALGIAVLGSIVNDRYRAGMAPVLDRLPPQIATRAEESIAFVQSGAAGQLGPDGPRLVAEAERAFVDGTTTAMLVAAALLLLSAVYVALRAPKRDEVAESAAQVAPPRDGQVPTLAMSALERANVNR